MAAVTREADGLICEGCGRALWIGGRWKTGGVSLRRYPEAAVWCSECLGDGRMKREALTAAQARGVRRWINGRLAALERGSR